MLLPEDVSDIDLSDLERLVSVSAQEDVRLDFKSIDVRKERIEHTICAFANTSGGHLVIGVSADQVTNCATGIPGVPAANGLLERWMQWLNEIRPRLDTRHSQLITVAQDRVACVLYQPASALAPHMASDYKYWLRAGPKNQEMPEEMVQRYYLARQVGDRAALDLLDSLAWGARPDNTALLSILICPMRLNNDTVTITPAMTQLFRERIQAVAQVQPDIDVALYEAAQALRPSYQGLRGNASASHDPNAFVEVRGNGLVRITASIDIVPTNTAFNPAPLIRLASIFVFVPRFIRAAAAVIDTMPYDGYVTVVCTLTQTQGKIVAGANALGLSPCAEDTLTFSREFIADDLQNQFNEISRWFVVRILQAFNHGVYEVTDQLLTNVIGNLSALMF